MNEKKHSNEGHSAGEKVAVGMGIAALAAAAAGAYFFYGTNEGAKRRKQMKGWMIRMRGEVMERMEAMQTMSESAYKQAVDTVARGYKGIKNVDPAEVAALAQEMKTHWKNIKKHLESAQKAPKTSKPRTHKKIQSK